MSGCGAWARTNVWNVDKEVDEPVVSLVEIMSEELVQNITEEDERRAVELYSSSPPAYLSGLETDEDIAKALQREFDREYDISVRLEDEKKKGNKTVLFTPDRYCPRTHQDSENDNSSDDDDETREAATALLYAKLTDSPMSSRMMDSDGDVVTKHDSVILARRNADKTLNDNVSIPMGDMVSEKINSKIYNSLRHFSKVEAKRQMRLKDKEETATMETSVDGGTRLAIFKWINQEVFDRVEGVIATGKESAVLHAVQGEREHFAIKVYKTSLTEFKNRSEYVKDDFRFKNAKKVLKIWAEREFMNLKRMNKQNLPCPSPIRVKKHLLLMSLIGDEGIAAPRLHNVEFGFFTDDEKREIYLKVESIICRLYKECRLVHADLSEYNLLLCNGEVYVIDVSQAMDISHPRNLFYLIRDIENILSFFANVGAPELPTSVTLFNLVTGLEMTEGDNLLVQVEDFSEDNRCVTLRSDKNKPADMEMRLYNAERAARDTSPAREFN